MRLGSDPPAGPGGALTRSAPHANHTPTTTGRRAWPAAPVVKRWGTRGRHGSRPHAGSSEAGPAVQGVHVACGEGTWRGRKGDGPGPLAAVCWDCVRGRGGPSWAKTHTRSRRCEGDTQRRVSLERQRLGPSKLGLPRASSRGHPVSDLSLHPLAPKREPRLLRETRAGGVESRTHGFLRLIQLIYLLKTNCVPTLQWDCKCG